MNRSVVFGVASMLLLSSMQLHADAMGKGLGFDVSPQSQSQSTAQAKSRKGLVPLSELKAVPEAMPVNPQCLSGGQPCAEEAQKAADDFKKQQEKSAGGGRE